MPLLVIMVIVATIAFVQTSTAQTSTSISQQQTQRTFIYWPAYSEIENMTNTSSDVLVGKVSAIKESYFINDIPVIKFNVVVEDLIKGNLQTRQTITVLQVASKDPEVQIRIDGLDVPIELGQESVFFLNHVPTSDTYYPIGGPQGRFIIQDSKIMSLDKIDPRVDWVSIKEIGDKPLANFKDEIRQTLKTSEVESN